MRLIAISLLVLSTQTACLSLHADVPEEAVRLHLAREEGIELASICAYEGKRFSEGAVTCMAAQRMTCGATGRWISDGGC